MPYSDLSEILFLDIETVSQFASYDEMPERFQNIWQKKAQFVSKDVAPEATYYEKSAIFAEFGKVIVIGIGVIRQQGAESKLRIKSLHSHDEKKLLEDFANFLNDNPSIHRLCAHNGKEFDFPYLCRRMLINKVPVPRLLQISNKKPWEIPHYDTLEMWKFGDWKNYTSLETLATVFDIPSSKSDIDGSKVNQYYYEKKDLDKIAEYCKNDVTVLVQLFLCMNQLQQISKENVTII